MVTAAGDPALRATVRRWLRAAPAADRVWCCADTRQPDPDGGDELVLEFAGQRIASVEAVASWRESGRGYRVDVVVCHPAFSALSERAREKVAVLMLDHAVGEEMVEIWVGVIETAMVAPTAGPTVATVMAGGHVDDSSDLSPRPSATTGSLRQLAAAVAAPQRSHLDESGASRWLLRRGRTAAGSTVLAAHQVPVHPSAAPCFDTHVRVEPPFTDRTGEGLPGPGSLPDLRGLQDALEDLVGDRGAVVAHETHDGTRVLHLYFDGETDGSDRVRAVAEACDQGRCRVQTTTDPAWDAVRQFRR